MAPIFVGGRAGVVAGFLGFPWRVRSFLEVLDSGCVGWLSPRWGLLGWLGLGVSSMIKK
jgi:hypothetical protein